MRSDNRHFGFGFIISLFILGCIVGYLSNYSDFFLEAYVGMTQDETQKESVNITIEPISKDPKQRAVALRDKVISEHPLYVEVERMEREILARSLEQTAYDTVFNSWQMGKSIGNPQEYLQNQSNSVIDSLTKTTNDLLERNQADKNLEKQTLMRRFENSMREQRQKINSEYYNIVTSQREIYIKDTEALKQKLQSLDVQTRYSIKVDIGITPKTSQLKTEDSEDRETKLSIQNELEAREALWESQLTAINLEREQRLLEVERQEKDRLNKELAELEERYQVLEYNIRQQMAEVAQGVESRRNNMSETFSQLENQTITQNKILISSYQQLQEKQLLDLIRKRDNLLASIEKEGNQTLRILALREGYEPGELVDTVPEGASDLTEKLLDRYRQTN